jgi:sialate O-acetylesterase
MLRSAFSKWLPALCFLIAIQANGQLKLPRLISDGAVLQRDVSLTIWGWASADENVSVTLNGKTYSTKADTDGNWKIALPPQLAGGPHELHFKGKNEITVSNVLFGDVWVCSGQSNMELPMERVKEKYRDVIAQATNPNIREFLVADKYDFKKEHLDLDAGSWKSVSPETVLGFSAVAYFFARDLYAAYNVPIGLINSALGGSPAEAWMSEDALKQFPDAWSELQRFKDDNLIKEIEQRDRQNSRQWYARLNATDPGLMKWHDAELDDSDWNEMTLPGYWADGPTGNVNGSMWFRKKINVPASFINKSGSLWVGRIVDADSVFVNGKFVGTTSYQYPPRRYSFGPDVLKAEENIISIRVISNAGRGGFVPDKPYFLAVGADTLDLKGTWKYKQGSVMPPQEAQTFIRWKPGGLYNRMISPLLNYSIKGVIWYQGESNTRDPKQYKEVFPAMIKNWRDKWKQGNFPFLFVQLANFMEISSEPTESSWAETRQAQFEALSLPNTGMAVIIDAGEWNDIHPLNKEDVGKRLALAARHVAYGEKNVVHSGPLYQSHKIKKNKVIITFSNTGSGLMAKGGWELKYFSIAGADKKFVWAQATIKKNKVVVWSDQVHKPVVVRYAWADNPEGANLYNKEGLPASPFTTEK